MKGKKIIVLVVVLFMCLLVAILTGVVALLITTQYSQNAKIAELQNQLLNSISNSSSNSTDATNSTSSSESDVMAEWSVSSKTDLEETADYKVNIIYPALANPDHLNVANHVNAYIMSSVEVFKDEITSMTADGALSKPSISLNYEVKYLSNNFVSIVISGSQYLGGAHPGSVFTTINYDLLNDTELTMSEVFNPGSDYLSTLSANTKAELVTLLGIDELDSQLVAGTAADIDNFELFYFTGTDSLEHLGIIFNEYQVAPYAAGPQTVELSVSLFESMFNSEFTALF